MARDEQPKECKATANSNEKCKKLELTLTKNKILMEQKLGVHNWKINWKYLEENDGGLESEKFFTAYDLCCFSLSVEYNYTKSCLDIYLHRCRCDDEEGLIENCVGLDYNIYVVCNNVVVHNNPGSLEDYSCLSISQDCDKSRGFVCLNLESQKVNLIKYEDFRISCKASFEE